MLSASATTVAPLSTSQNEDLRRASSKILGPERRSFQVAMTLEYCRGNPRQAKRVFGWKRDTIELGLNEQRMGVICLEAQAAYCGNRLCVGISLHTYVAHRITERPSGAPS
ncbi:hypothetical protein SAMN05421863_11217 [Nitrosomonas communis]|uniref:Uncharacterized protein n=1 Tax=Nitrosomonas communis TaxID=44574 RepID=A0A1I4WW01_9PROT|nr:hypothetical protein SAMN05421863_11217 [Nitrosomonas communis]